MAISYRLAYPANCIGGESYGATRSTAEARELSEREGSVGLIGILLISIEMDFYTSGSQTGNELG